MGRRIYPAKCAAKVLTKQPDQIMVEFWKHLKNVAEIKIWTSAHAVMRSRVLLAWRSSKLQCRMQAMKMRDESPMK